MMRDILVMDCGEYEAFWRALKIKYKILFTTTAKEGLDILSKTIGLVFLRIRLPDINGLEVLKLIKNAYPSTAVIIITSSGTEETCLEAFRKGARDYLKKPLNTDEITEKIELLMQMSDDSQRRRHVSLSTETIHNEDFPDIPPHLVEGVLKVRDFVSQNYSESLTLSAACKMATISKTYFCRFFKYITGHSLRSYHNIVKIHIAEELLCDKRLSIADVAMRLGYDDPNYFSTIYKKITGYSPREWQSSHRIQHREKERTFPAEIAHANKYSRIKSEPEFKRVLREWQDSYYSLFMEKEASGIREYQDILREWQDSYLSLFRDKGKSWAEDIAVNESSSVIQKRISGISSGCKKTALRSFDKLKNINMELDKSLEYIEP